MQKKIPYNIVVRRLATGEEHARLIFAADESIARERAMVRARHALGATFVERESPAKNPCAHRSARRAARQHGARQRPVCAFRTSGALAGAG